MVTVTNIATTVTMLQIIHYCSILNYIIISIIKYLFCYENEKKCLKE